MTDGLIARLRAAVNPDEIEDLEPFIRMLIKLALKVIDMHQPQLDPEDPDGGYVCPWCCEAYEAGHYPAPSPCPYLVMIADLLEVPVRDE